MADGNPLPVVTKPVKVLLEMDAPPLAGRQVGVHYFEEGSYRRISVEAVRPTYFAKIVVASVQETLPVYAYPNSPFDSVRNIARNGINSAKTLGLLLSAPATYSQPVLDMRYLSPNNMAHILLDIVPFYLLAKRAAGEDTVLLLQPAAGPFASLLGVFGIEAIDERRRVTGNMVKIRGTRGLAVKELFGTHDCTGIDFLPDTYAGMNFAAEPSFEKIFLSRRPPRNLKNQAEVERVIGEFGYRTVYLEDYSIREQLSIGAQARHVIAVHGAAMSFLLVNKRIDSLIELFPPNVHHDIFSKCLSPRTGRYEQILESFDPKVTHSGWESIYYFKDRNFSVHTGLLERLLSEIHAGSREGMPAPGAGR